MNLLASPPFDESLPSTAEVATSAAAAVARSKRRLIHTGIVGCGFVSDFYLKTLAQHQECFQLSGVTDQRLESAERLARHYSLPTYGSLEELLEDDRIELVVNLTNPHAHFEVSKACLNAGKHVYTEKPLAMEFSEAKALVDLAERRGLWISSAPSRILGETAQTMWKALRDQSVGNVRLIYAEMDDGLVHKMPYQRWASDSGAPWPYKDEFEVGCTVEHAGYVLTWLTAFFGPAKSVTAFASCLVADKQTDVPLDNEAPDFTVACIQFASGPVARLSCSIIAPPDHSIRIFGDDGILCTDDCWKPRSPVYIRRSINVRRRTVMLPWRTRCRLLTADRRQSLQLDKVDFNLGVAEFAQAIREQRPPLLSPQYCLHVNELTLAIHNAVTTGMPYRMTTSFDKIEPLEWAR